jgi:hypothetical protein
MSTWNFELSHIFNIQDLNSPIGGLLDELYSILAHHREKNQQSADYRSRLLKYLWMFFILL